MTEPTLSEWAFEQCVIKGHTIVAVKNESGVNTKFVNSTTGEEFTLPPAPTNEGD